MRMDLGNVGKLEPGKNVGSKIIGSKLDFWDTVRVSKETYITYGLSVDYKIR